MRAYGKLETSFWQNQKVKRLSERGRLLLVYMLSCPHGNAVGCFILSDGYIMADLRWSAEQVREHVSELVSKGFLERDEDTELTRVRGWWGHNTIENGNVARGALKTFRQLPRCLVFYNAVKALVEADNKFINALRNEFADVFATPNLTEPKPKEASSLRSDGDASRAVVEVPEADAPLKDRIFGPCLHALSMRADKPPNKLRSVIGRWCSQYGDGPVLDALIRCERAAAVDPVPWIEQTLRNTAGKRAGADDSERLLAQLEMGDPH